MYNNNLIAEIRELKEKKDFFKLVTQSYKGNLPYWTDIWEYIQAFYTYNEHHYSSEKCTRYFYNPDRLKYWEDLGVNYNFLDNGGNNFAQYMFSSGNSNRDKHPVFSEESKSYVLEKTTDVYRTNAGGQHILFYMLGVVSGGVEGENFFELIKQFPNFNYHQIANDGKNLLAKAVLENASNKIFDFLLSENVSLKLTDKNEQNILHLFGLTSGITTTNKDFFNRVLMENDMTHKDYRGEAALERWLSFSVAQDIHVQNREIYKKITFHVLKKIVEQKFYRSSQSLINLENILEENQKPFSEELRCFNLDKADKAINLYSSALSSVKYLMLNEKLQHKNAEVNLRKIKI